MFLFEIRPVAIMGGSSQLISVHPEELRFQFELEKQSYCDLKVANNSEHHVAFKVKTTSPKKYFVRPNTGVVQPWDSCVITVTLQAQREYPPDMQCKDKFLLQSTIVPPNTDVDEIPQDAFNKDGEKTIEEFKLRVVYTSPAGHGNSEDESSLTVSSKQSHSNNHILRNSSIDDIRTVQRLKEERDLAIQQTQQLQRELDLMRRRMNRRSDPGFSLAFAACVGLIGIVVGLIFRLVFSVPSDIDK
ncbi:PREDICTED: vesicle-associated protein 2-1-like isoform X2 [Nelumbo nucifera]|uniref:Vesicle-associated protein 2-1-like isoform X2 n=1 Tax=Nelumbo nucifera TaxID=4432 RepID=A0A1U8B3R4_NELNU|nr:PREDICTED: vesicle-associated protein 2-1-like isoform X2 [Nelumbo nucifera]XP_010275478.1 PREDICTED: vesicle-associated protein 2-1-like isoform X2 [Nelumbo nucifera]